MSLLKVPYLVLGVICTRIAWTPPNPPVPTSERSIKEFFIGSRASQIQSTVPLGLLTVEALAIGVNALKSYYPQASPLIPDFVSALMFDGDVNRLQSSTPFYVGIAALSIGAFFRLTCYNLLGKLFTYEVNVNKEHKLITTGPYSIVRHPSYTAFYANVFGLLLMVWSRGSWLRESGFLNTIFGRTLIPLSMFGWAYGLLMLTKRTAQEDKLLRDKFGEEWDEWAARVPWRLFPGIY